jgi:hypothetical protein
MRCFAVSVLLVICGCAGPELVDDQEDFSETPLGKADALGTTSTYYSVRPDRRKCIAPLCGGFWIQRLNQATTRCADGKYQAECYVASMDLSALALSPAETTATLASVEAELLRGTVGKMSWGTTTLGTFTVSEAWRSASPGAVPSGTYYRVDPNPIRCVTTPCPAQYHQAKLNSTVSATLYGFSGLLADPLAGALQGADPVLAAGTNHGAKTGKVLEASQFWARIVAAPTSDASCATDADCTVSAYDHFIGSTAECYCIPCPTTAMNLAAEGAYRTNWEQYCSAVRLVGPYYPPCLAQTARCVNGACAL